MRVLSKATRVLMVTVAPETSALTDSRPSGDDC